jgi:hypothetical protein
MIWLLKPYQPEGDPDRGGSIWALRAYRTPWDGTSALLLKQADFRPLGISSTAIAAEMGRTIRQGPVGLRANRQTLAAFTQVDVDVIYAPTPILGRVRAIVRATQGSPLASWPDERQGDRRPPLDASEWRVAQRTSDGRSEKGRGRLANNALGVGSLDCGEMTAIYEARDRKRPQSRLPMGGPSHRWPPVAALRSQVRLGRCPDR